MKHFRALGIVVGTGLVSSALYAGNGGKADSVPDEIIIKVKSGMEKRFWNDKAFHGKSEYAVNRPIKVSFGNFYVVKIGSKVAKEKVISEIANNPAIEYAEPNFIYRFIDWNKNVLDSIVSSEEIASDYTTSQLNDPMFNKLWGFSNDGNNEPTSEIRLEGVKGADISAIRAWEKYRSGDRNVKIAVIDTGIDYNHEDLKNNIWVNEAELNGTVGVDDDSNGYIDDIHGYDFANNDSDPIDGHSHGTHCAGTIAAEHNNGVGVAGVLSEVSLVPVKFLGDDGSGTTEAAILSIDYATKMNVDLMSNSWGGGGYSKALFDAISRASEKGILFVAAAGNSSTNNDSSPHYPSNYNVPNIISVAAHAANDTLASFSCYGGKTVHIAAPGKNILSTVAGNKYAVYSGTSMATPHVSGILGMLIVNEGRLPLAEVKERLIATSIPVNSYKNKTISGGRVNLYNLLANERPIRNEPDPNKWQELVLETPFESTHPYDNRQRIEKRFSVPKAKYMRLIVSKMDLEEKYDFINVKDKNDVVADSLSGVASDLESLYVEGDEMVVEFVSDSSINKWGFIIDRIEYQM